MNRARPGAQGGQPRARDRTDTSWGRTTGVTRGWNGNTQTVEEPERDEPDELEASVLPEREAISLISPDPVPPVDPDAEPEEDQLH